MNTKEKNGILVAGTVIVDKINTIAAYPDCGQLTKILSLQTAVGGCVPNVAHDLKRIDPELPVYAAGTIGADEEGQLVKDTLGNAGVDVSGLVEFTGERTSFTEVMSILGGQRTFFTYAGASAQFGSEHVDFGNARLLHLGYFLLLDRVDNGEGLKILQAAREAGLETSIDLVSENSDRYTVVRPCLPYTDYLIINELEAGKLADMEPTNENLEAIARRLKDMGVRKRVVIHKPDRAVCCSEDGFCCVPSYALPDGFIQGTTGAGDAFCAGALTGIYRGWDDVQTLEFASACAVMALGGADASEGLRPIEETKAFCSRFNRQQL